MPHENVDGKLRRLVVKETGCDMWLDQQGERYFELRRAHKNYNSLYALLLAAASNRWKVSFRLRSYEPPEEPPNEIQYVFVDYPQ